MPSSAFASLAEAGPLAIATIGPAALVEKLARIADRGNARRVCPADARRRCGADDPPPVAASGSKSASASLRRCRWCSAPYVTSELAPKSTRSAEMGAASAVNAVAPHGVFLRVCDVSAMRHEFKKAGRLPAVPVGRGRSPASSRSSRARHAGLLAEQCVHQHVPAIKKDALPAATIPDRQFLPRSSQVAGRTCRRRTHRWRRQSGRRESSAVRPSSRV